MKPGDIIAIPSIAGPADYIEDFEITEISYSQEETGFIRMSLSAQRPLSGQEGICWTMPQSQKSKAFVKG